MADKELTKEEKEALKILEKGAVKNVEEAVSLLSEKKKIPFEKATKMIFKLWKKGYIDMVYDKEINILHYAMSVESSWFWILVSVIIFTIILVFHVKNPPLIYIRYILGSLYVLYIPGATLIEALYPRGEELEPLERLALSIGLSLALVPLVGLVLNYTPWGIRLGPVTISLALLSILLALIALKRKYEYYALTYG